MTRRGTERRTASAAGSEESERDLEHRVFGGQSETEGTERQTQLMTFVEGSDVMGDSKSNSRQADIPPARGEGRGGRVGGGEGRRGRGKWSEGDGEEERELGDWRSAQWTGSKAGRKR